MYLGINDMGREIVHVSEAPVNDELKGNMEQWSTIMAKKRT